MLNPMTGSRAKNLLPLALFVYADANGWVAMKQKRKEARKMANLKKLDDDARTMIQAC